MLPTSSLAAVFIFSAIIGFGAVVSPGPIATAIVSQAPRRGWVVGPWIATGHALLELAIVLLISYGLGAGLARPGIQTAIALGGGLLLGWMGISMIWGIWKGKTHLPGKEVGSKSLSTRKMVMLGVVGTITNPFWYAWWVTVAAGYLAQAQVLGIAAILAFFLGHVAADYAWDTFLSAVIGGGRRWMTDRIYQAIIVICGAFFVYLGWVFLSNGLSKIL